MELAKLLGGLTIVAIALLLSGCETSPPLINEECNKDAKWTMHYEKFGKEYTSCGEKYTDPKDICFEKCLDNSGDCKIYDCCLCYGECKIYNMPSSCYPRLSK